MKLTKFVGPLVASLYLFVGTAWGATIDLQSLGVVGFGNTSAGQSYAEDGFILTALDGEPPHFQFFESMEPRYPGSTALYFGQPDMSAHLALRRQLCL